MKCTNLTTKLSETQWYQNIYKSLWTLKTHIYTKILFIRNTKLFSVKVHYTWIEASFSNVLFPNWQHKLKTIKSTWFPPMRFMTVSIYLHIPFQSSGLNLWWCFPPMSPMYYFSNESNDGWSADDYDEYRYIHEEIKFKQAWLIQFIQCLILFSNERFWPENQIVHCRSILCIEYLLLI